MAHIHQCMYMYLVSRHVMSVIWVYFAVYYHCNYIIPYMSVRILTIMIITLKVSINNVKTLSVYCEYSYCIAVFTAFQIIQIINKWYKDFIIRRMTHERIHMTKGEIDSINISNLLWIRSFLNGILKKKKIELDIHESSHYAVIIKSMNY